MINPLDFVDTAVDYSPLFVQEKIIELTDAARMWMTPEANGFLPIDITVDGVKKTYYRQTGDSNTGSGDYIHFGGPDGMKISEKSYSDPWSFFTPNLLGGSVEYDVDLSQMECGCVAAFYLVLSPALDWNGNPVPGSGNDYYCDANQVGGSWCPEFDIMEAN